MDTQKLIFAAEIGKINIDNPNLKDLKNELEGTINFLESITSIEVNNNYDESKSRVIKLENLREDIPIDSCVSQDILENVPHRLGYYVKVPKIMEKNIKGK